MYEATTYHCFGAFEDHLHDSDEEATGCQDDQQAEADAYCREAEYGETEAEFEA